jgi:TolA protein
MSRIDGMKRLFAFALLTLILLGFVGVHLFSSELAYASSKYTIKEAERALLGLAGEIRRQVYRNWYIEEENTGYEVTIRVHVRRSGEVISVKVIESNGSRAFDNSALQAIRSASPLPFPLEAKFYPQIEELKKQIEELIKENGKR